MRAPALYWHFASKEAILFAIIERSFADFHRSLRFTADGPEARLTELVRSYVTFQLEQSPETAVFSSYPALSMLGNILTEEHQDQLRAMQREVYELFKECLTSGAVSGEFRIGDTSVTAFAMISLCEYVNTWAQQGGKRTPREIAAEYVVFALRMAGVAGY